jgi:hypothetical protein
LGRYEEDLFRFIENRHTHVFILFLYEKHLSDVVMAALNGALDEFKIEFTSSKS